MIDTLDNFVLTDSIQSLGLNPTFNYLERALLNRTRTRAQAGKMSTYTVLTDTVDAFTLPIEYIGVAEATAVNSWWAGDAPLWFTISPRAEIPVRITNIQKPFFQQMRNDLYAYRGVLNLITIV